MIRRLARTNPDQACSRRAGLLRPARHQQRTHRSDQRPPRTPPRLRPRLPQPHQLTLWRRARRVPVGKVNLGDSRWLTATGTCAVTCQDSGQSAHTRSLPSWGYSWVRSGYGSTVTDSEGGCDRSPVAATDLLASVAVCCRTSPGGPDRGRRSPGDLPYLAAVQCFRCHSHDRLDRRAGCCGKPGAPHAAQDPSIGRCLAGAVRHGHPRTVACQAQAALVSRSGQFASRGSRVRVSLAPLPGASRSEAISAGLPLIFTRRLCGGVPVACPIGSRSYVFGWSSASAHQPPGRQARRRFAAGGNRRRRRGPRS